VVACVQPFVHAFRWRCRKRLETLPASGFACDYKSQILTPKIASADARRPLSVRPADQPTAPLVIMHFTDWADKIFPRIGPMRFAISRNDSPSELS